MDWHGMCATQRMGRKRLLAPEPGISGLGKLCILENERENEKNMTIHCPEIYTHVLKDHFWHRPSSS